MTSVIILFFDLNIWASDSPDRIFSCLIYKTKKYSKSTFHFSLWSTTEFSSAFKIESTWIVSWNIYIFRYIYIYIYIYIYVYVYELQDFCRFVHEKIEVEISCRFQLKKRTEGLLMGRHIKELFLFQHSVKFLPRIPEQLDAHAVDLRSRNTAFFSRSLTHKS